MHIMVATDGSPEASYALKEATRILNGQAKWTVIAVADPGPTGSDLGYFGTVLPLPHPEAEAARVAAEGWCEAACTEFVHLGFSKPDALVVVGNPVDTILGEGHRLGVDVLVVGTHGRGWLGRLFLGSVSETLVHQFRGAIFIARHPTG